MSLLFILLGALAVALLTPVLLFPSQTLKFLRRKNYQYEVTFGLYMLTPTEKVILNSFIFVTISMIVLATFFYLPSHIGTIYSRVFYYYSGHFLHTASHPLLSMAGGVAHLNNALQTLHNQTFGPHRLVDASQQVVSGAHDLVKGLAAGAVAQVAQTLNGAAAAAEHIAADMVPETATTAVSQSLQAHMTADPL